MDGGQGIARGGGPDREMNDQATRPETAGFLFIQTIAFIERKPRLKRKVS
jgi:hypothetical protein